MSEERGDYGLCDTAADEIERLRKDVHYWCTDAVEKLERLRAVERPADPTSDAQKAAMAWLDYCEAPSHARTLKAMLKRPADPRGWHDAPIFAFLLGSGPLDGQWFGDKHPTERGAFWWRKHLRDALSPAPKDREGG